MIDRYLQPVVERNLSLGLVSIVYGARQTGKTTLAKAIASKFANALYLDCDEPKVRLALTNVGSEELRSTIGTSDLVVIDEAQRIENIGITAKLIHDNKLTSHLILTGSSSLDLANKIKEPLTGRSIEYILQPLSIFETGSNNLQRDEQTERHLIYGGYPGFWGISQQLAETQLTLLASNYLYRDAFNPNTLYDTTIMHRLLQMLALQIGSEISYDSLAMDLLIKRETVMRYIDLLEKAFIIYRIQPYRRNMRTEIGRLRKVYFNDLGVRNGLIEDFRPMHLRQDNGALWENFIFNELRKSSQRAQNTNHYYYWRSRRKLELDVLAAVGENILFIGECKLKKTNIRIPQEFIDTYGKMDPVIFNRLDYLDKIESVQKTKITRLPSHERK
jgi:uncharacterized protein